VIQIVDVPPKPVKFEDSDETDDSEAVSKPKDCVIFEDKKIDKRYEILVKHFELEFRTIASLFLKACKEEFTLEFGEGSDKKTLGFESKKTLSWFKLENGSVIQVVQPGLKPENV